MKKIIISIVLIISPIIMVAQQQNTPFIEVLGTVNYKAKAEKYIASIEMSKYLINNVINKEDITFADIKENYFKKLKNAGFDRQRFKEISMKYLSYSQDKSVMLIFETESKEEFENVLSIKSAGVNIMYKDVIFKITNQQLENLSYNAIEKAKKKAEKIALKNGRKIGKIIMISDHNSATIKEALYYLNADGEKLYLVTVRFELL